MSSARVARAHTLRVPAVKVAEDEYIIAPQAGPQTQFIAASADIVVYGGAAGGGKSWGLILDASRYAALEPVKGFGAVIFRRTSPQITQQGGLWDESGKLYPLAGGKANQTRLEWSWPQYGTRVRFAHMQYESDRFNWQGSQIPYIGFDELTHFTAEQFWYMLSRNRSVCGVKPRIRATTNPDADSWVKEFLAPWVDDQYPDPAQSGEVRYFYRDGGELIWLRKRSDRPAHITLEQIKSCTFIAASIYDNRILMEQNPEYLANLQALPLIERERLLSGNWNIRPSGNKFKRHWFKIVEPEAVPWQEFIRIVRGWDFAATEPAPGKDPDWTAGVKMARTRDNRFYVLNVVHERLSSKGTDDLLVQTAALDGKSVTHRLEQEPGSSGKRTAAQQRQLLAGYHVRVVKPTGDKSLRANPLSSQVEGGNVYVVNAEWTQAFINELCAFPQVGVHDDIVDGADSAFDELTLGVDLNEHVQRRLELRQVQKQAAQPTPGLVDPDDDDWY